MTSPSERSAIERTESGKMISSPKRSITEHMVNFDEMICSVTLINELYDEMK